MSTEKNTSLMPSKKFIFGTLGLIVVLVGVLIISNIIEGRQEDELEIIAEPMTFNEIMSLDSNGNGIPNWEESLWGFNPFVLDTNGDGVSDAEYIMIYREQNRSADFSELGAGFDTNTSESDILARQVYTTLAMMEGIGGNPEDISDDIIDALRMKVQQPALAEPVRASDLNTASRNDIDMIIYTDELVFNLQKMVNLTEQMSDLIPLLDDEDLRGNEEELEEFGYIAEEYNIVFNDLKNMRVPRDAQNMHARFANTAGNMSHIMTDLSKINNDPLVSFQGFLRLNTFLEEMEKSLEEADAYLQTLTDNIQ